MKKSTLILLLILLPLGILAQNHAPKGHHGQRRHFNKEEFRQRAESYITQEASLTENEAKVFFPIYNEYKDKQRQIHMSIHKLKRDAPEQGNEKAHKECLLKIARLNAEVAGLDSIYYKKICQVISAEKFYKILGIEDRMHRKMLQNYNRGRGEEKKK